MVSRGIATFPRLEKVLQDSGLGTTIPNPGYVLDGMTYDSTTKFERAGDREISKEEERRFSGLDDEGHHQWTEVMFPTFAQFQIDYAKEHNVLNMDGKGECVAYRKKPIVTDFACNPDENRLMLRTIVDGVEWLIPSNKEIQRAVFTKEGVDVAIAEAKKTAETAGSIDRWRDYLPNALNDHNIDITAVSEHSCNLMAYAIAEVGNRMLGRTVFDAKPLDNWIGEFVPYASKLERQA